MDLSLTAGLLMLGVAAVAPLALVRSGLGRTTTPRVVVPVGVLAAISLLLPQGSLATTVAAPSLALAAGTTVLALLPTLQAVTAVRSGVLVGTGGVGPARSVEWVLGPDTRAAGGPAPPVLVAIGFVAVPALQVVGAVVFAAALLAWSLQAGRVPGGGVQQALWSLARLSVWISMPLAGLLALPRSLTPTGGLSGSGRGGAGR